MQKLQVPNPQFVGAFRGEPNLENIQVHIGGRYGVAACDVPAALNHFNDVLQRAVRRLDEWIPTDVELGPDQLAAIVEVCAWAHSEWVRIHPFANGNGRTARLWVNCLASRYGLPPFLRLRPRPEGRYALACARAMLADRAPTVALFHELLASFPAWDDRET
jgi:fido (protein-threonine AMPylation protein)